MKVPLATLVILVIIALPAFGQSGAELDRLLGTGEVSMALSARFVLPAAGLLPENATPEAAFAAAVEKGFLPAGAMADSPIRLSDLSFMITRAFGIDGGAMYKLAPGPRYAYRELVYLRIIQGVSDPARTVSGERLVRILGRVLDRQGDES